VKKLKNVNVFDWKGPTPDTEKHYNIEDMKGHPCEDEYGGDDC
jgi:hypothetical protein